MKKGYLIPAITLTCILTGTLWISSAVSSLTERWQTQLQAIDLLACQSDWTGAAAALSDSYADWKSHQTWMRIITQHDRINEAEAMYHRAMAFALTQEFSEFRTEIFDLQTQFRLLAETERFSTPNIL